MYRIISKTQMISLISHKSYESRWCMHWSHDRVLGARDPDLVPRVRGGGVTDLGWEH